MKLKITNLPLTFVLVFAACGTWSGSIVETTDGKRFTSASVHSTADKFYFVGPGTDEVLQLEWRRKEPGVIDAVFYSSALLQIDSQLLKLGAELQIPGDGVEGFLYVFSAPMPPERGNLQGKLRIVEIQEGAVLAFLTLEAPDIKWTYTGEVNFVWTAITERQN